MLRAAGDMWRQPSWRAPEAEMAGKHVVVTGPSVGGIGFHAALGLLQRGARLTLACRSLERGKEASKELAINVGGTEQPPAVLQCDVSSCQSVRDFAAALLATTPDVDVLVNNAGAVVTGTEKSPEGVDMTFATCALGHHLLNQLLRPKRIVWVMGDIYCMAKPPAIMDFPGDGWAAYNNACLGRILLAHELARRGGVEVVAVHPGVIATNLAKAGRCIKGLLRLIMITPELGAQGTIYAASCPSSELPNDTIYHHNKFGWMRLPPNDKAMDSAQGQALFEACDRVCGIERG